MSVQPRPATGYAGDLTATEAWDLLASDPQAVLVDVRTDAEWRYVGVPDLSDLGRQAVLVEWVSYPSGQQNTRFLDQLVDAGLTPDRPVVFLCRSGQRSIGAAQTATAAGYGPAYNVLDGIEGATGPDGHRGHTGWRADGLPWVQP